MHDAGLREAHIVLFDGVCNLCHGSVQFILRHEPAPIVRFASIQSDAGKELLAGCGLPRDFSDAVIYIENGQVHQGATAALRIGQRLKFPWSMLASVGLLVPTGIRDYIYGHIGRHRYQWFGRTDLCIVPTETLKSRFL